MHQKKNSLTWRFIALLFVFSIGISLLAMSPMLAFAKMQSDEDSASLNIWKTPGSAIGSVKVVPLTVSGTTGALCVKVEAATTLVPVPIGFRKGDNAEVLAYRSSDCTGSQVTDTVLTRLANMPPCSTSRSCRVYTIYTMAKEQTA